MRNVEAKVGLFVVVTAVILGVTVYFVSHSQFGEKQVLYKIYLRYAGGLEAGTDVLFGGMAVGKVTELRADPADPTRIEISLNVRQGTPLNAQSVAKLESTSLMSSPVVSITTGSNQAPRLPAGAVITSQEAISMDDMQRKVVALADSAQSTLKSVQTDLNRLTGEAQTLLVNLNTLTGQTNQKHVAAILSNADTMVAQVSSKLGPTVENVNATVSNINATVSNVNTTVGNANGTITALREPIQTDLNELRRTLEETHNLIGHVDTLLLANHQNISDSLENIRMATDNLNDLTQSVKERPWSLVRIRQREDRKVPEGQLK